MSNGPGAVQTAASEDERAAQAAATKSGSVRAFARQWKRLRDAEKPLDQEAA